MTRVASAMLLAATVSLTACLDEPNPVAPETVATTTPELAVRSSGTPFEMDPVVQADIEARLTDLAHQKSATLAAMRADAGVALPEGVSVAPLGFSWIGALDGEIVGNDVFFLDRGNKQLVVQWVPEDPRRNGRTDIGYAVDELFGFGVYDAPGVTAAQSLGAIDRAMATWDGQTCSGGLTIPKGDFIDWLFFDSDVFHEGFFPLPPGVLGATFPFIFVSGGVPTDIDGDGAFDYAFAIIDYSSNFVWGIDTNVFPFIDVETVALHEMGHGLAQAHFGTAFETLSNGKIHFGPRSVMNAGYSGLQQSLKGTDRGGHCSMYGSWPNN